MKSLSNFVIGQCLRLAMFDAPFQKSKPKPMNLLRMSDLRPGGIAAYLLEQKVRNAARPRGSAAAAALMSAPAPAPQPAPVAAVPAPVAPAPDYFRVLETPIWKIPASRRCKPSEWMTRIWLDGKRCPLSEIVVSKANQGNFAIIKNFAFTALSRPDRSCRGLNMGFYAPPGQGKTFLAKALAATIGLPFVMIQAQALDSTWTVLQMIQEQFEKCGAPIEQQDGEYDYVIPPCIVFFDEAHGIKQALMKFGLLTAMEPDDGLMVVKVPGSKSATYRVDCRNICWWGATTERGALFDAFESRLTTAIEWAPATDEELQMIVERGLTRKFKAGEVSIVPPPEVCGLIAKYQKVPRLAIHGFGLKVVLYKQQFSTMSWEEACHEIATSMGLNRWGLDEKQVEVLKALGQRPIAENRLSQVARCRVAQVQRFIMPGLMRYGDGGPFVCSVPGKGMCITRSGIALLKEMGIPSKGDKVTVEFFEQR